MSSARTASAGAKRAGAKRASAGKGRGSGTKNASADQGGASASKRRGAAATLAPAAPRALATALDRQSPLPLYAQVARRLKAMITAHEHPADRFYSEGELCEMFGVSRATVRQAVQELSADGWLRSERGAGTFVNRDRFDEAFSPLMNFLDQWAQVGRPLHLELRRFEMAVCPAEFAGWLGITPRTPVLCIERVRGNGPDTISYDYRYIHPDCASYIEREAVETTSLLHLLDRGLRLLRGENKVGAALAGPAHAALLGVTPDAPILIRDMVYFSDDGLPAMVGRSLYRADRIRCAFTVGLADEQATTPATVQPSAGHPGGIADIDSADAWPGAGSKQ